MKISRLVSAIVALFMSQVGIAKDQKNPKPKSLMKRGAAKPADPSAELVEFEGCGRKDKGGKWVEFYPNCKGFNGSKFSPAPPCREGWVKVEEAVPPNLVQNLEQCIYEL